MQGWALRALRSDHDGLGSSKSAICISGMLLAHLFVLEDVVEFHDTQRENGWGLRRRGRAATPHKRV